LACIFVACAGCHFDVEGLDLGAGTDDLAVADLALDLAVDLALADLTAVPDLSNVDLLVPPDLARSHGPSTDVAENVLGGWTVGESTNDVPVPCNPSNPLGRVTLSAELTQLKAGSEAVHLGYTQSNDFQAVYPSGLNASWDLSTRTGLHVWIHATEGAGYGGWSPAGPTLILCGPGGAYRTISPIVDALGGAAGAYTQMQIPLAGGGNWISTNMGGFDLTQVRGFELHFDPLCGACTLTSSDVWLDDAYFYP